MAGKTIHIHCKGKHKTYATRRAAEDDGVWAWAVRVVTGEDHQIHAFESEEDYRNFKKVSPTNYR
jgi:hypothetical protein